MKNLFKKALCFTLTLLMLASMLSISAGASTQNGTPRVFILGDSTAARYTDKERPMTGWGEMIYNFFNDKIVVDDRAVSGATSKSFYEKHWAGVKGSILKGDYVLIQFCHNDQKYGITGQSDVVIDGFNEMSADEKFAAQTAITKEYVEKFIAEVKEKEATPIIITSIERRNRVYGNQGIDMTPWINLYKSIAKEKGVTCLDLNPKTWELYQSYGEEGSKKLFVIVNPGEYDGYPDGKTDNTHLREKGAFEVAKLIAQLIKASDSSLKNYLAATFPDAAGLPSLVFEEDFERGTVGAEIASSSAEGYNKWFIGDINSGQDQNVDKVYISYDSTNTNKVAQFVRNQNGKTNPTLYSLRKNVTEEIGRYIGWTFRIRSDAADTGQFMCRLYDSNEKRVDITFVFSNNTIYVTADGTTDTVSNAGIKDNEWYNVEVYIDLEAHKLKMYVNNSAKYEIENVKIEDAAYVKYSFNRTAGCTSATSTADVKVDDILIRNLSQEEYNDAIETLGEGTLFKETFNRQTQGTNMTTGSFNGWVCDNVSSKVHKYSFVADPRNSANTVLALQRTGVPGGNTFMTKTLTQPLTDGFYSLKFKLMKNNDNDRTLEVSITGTDTYKWKTFFHLNEGNVSTVIARGDSFTSVSAPFDADAAQGTVPITKGKWYDIEMVYNLNGEKAALTLYIDGRKALDNITPPNLPDISVSTTERWNNGTIKSIVIGPSRLNGSLLGNDQKREEYTYDANTLIADIRLDDIELKTLHFNPTDVVYNQDGGKLEGVKVNANRLFVGREKMLAAVYTISEGKAVLKGVSECNAATSIAQTNLTLKKALDVSTGDIIKIFFWDMSSLKPIGLLQTSK